ncbi:uncharacterized protein LOC144877179 [Branchiostoma floridae x Branchiostoma japonicum]
MKTNTVLFVVIVRLLFLSNWTYGEVHLSAKIAENADIGQQVVRVLPTTAGAKEEVPCDIIDGNVHGRFSVIHFCVIVVARPLDFGINRRYNLTVNVPGTTETRFVEVQVEDVDGYPPIYNDTCELPVLGNDKTPGHLLFNATATGKYMEKSGGLFIMKADTKNYQPSRAEKMHTCVQSYTSSDCIAVFVVGIHHASDLRTVNGLWLSYNRCFPCFDPLDSEHFFQTQIISDDHIPCEFLSGLDSTIIDRESYVWNKYKFKLLINFKVRSTEKQRFICKFPQRRPISVLTRQNYAYDEILLSILELEIQPIGCPPNKYGLACDQNCTCENGGRCHGLNGACKCQPGWKGVVCDIPHSTVAIIATPSDSRQIHIRGSLTLQCKSFHLAAEKLVGTFPNGTRRRLRGTQDEIRIESIQSEHNGTYTCTVITEDETEVTARYELQAVNCPPGKRGELCEEDCNCLHGASCDRWAGCVCPPGWTGKICETKCPDGTYGRGCSGECTCQNGAFCDPTDGQCNCTEGWYGMYCTRPCFSGRYGWRCRQACDCKNNATCHHVDGSCTCAPPWTGRRCDVIQPETSPLPLQISIPLLLTLLGVLVALLALYKWRTTTRMRQDEDQEETQVLLELKSMEENLAQSLQPGWLKRWERKAKDLTLGDLIGQGAFSFIREGRLRTANAEVTVVAVKSVRSRDRLCYRAFYREAAMLVALDENGKEHNNDGHPNIIKLFGVITKSTPKCILLEYAAKGDLLQLLKQQNTDNVAPLLGSFLRYAVHTSRGLKELRRLRIAHGDVAARNVLITGDDVAKLSDFGLAHDVYTTTTYISSGKNDAEELLPLKWMALESLETRKFTCESDTWSFGVLLWEIAAFGEEPDYQHEILLTCPRLVGILRQGYRMKKPPGCPDRLYDVMKSCWCEDPSARPEPVELEQKLTDCREQIDPLFILEKTNIVLFVIVRLLALFNWTYGKVHLSAKIAENADIGQQVFRVLPTTPGAKEEVPCDIIDGNVHGRFSVTHYCVIVVARPLDFSINQRYNLTVNVSGTTETRLVNIQVEDVDGYPPIYNDTCEMPVLGKDRAPGHLAFSMAVTTEYMEKNGWLFTWRADTKNRLQISASTNIFTYASSDCIAVVMLGTRNAKDSTRTQRFICELPQEGFPMLMSRNNAFDDVFVTRLETKIQPIGCPPNKYGLTCDQNCTCENGARCHGLNGACKCQPGWKGVVCDIPHSTVAIIATPSDSRQIHIKGSLTLHCKSFHLVVEKMVWTFPNRTRRRVRGTQEDQIRIESIQSEHNGTYTCTVITKDETEVHARYELQAVHCPAGKRGDLCEDDCNCLHGASCDRWAGCVCPPGWIGNMCQIKCPDGTYGRRCNGECPCQNGAVCDPTDGQCNCTEGWYGMHCTRPCLSGRYGWRCRQACDCKNNATCHHVDGSCTCAPPWTGQRCDVIKPETSLLPLQISLPLLSTLLGVLAALVALYKWRTVKRLGRDENQEETQVLLELKSMEENLAQSLQPGWLKRWERKAKDLTQGDLIGQGAFSFIREGRLRTANADVTVVAVKSVRSEDRLCYRAFYRDAAMLVTLDNNCKEHNPDGHPNIIKLFGVITRSRPRCILLEYAAKGDLLQLLKQQTKNNVARLLGSFLRYAVHISRALKELRRLRIAHGDVAARNILISGDDVAKLSDFGLAHDVYTTTTYISSGKNDAEELLPLKWMALESLETRKFTCESDTWSFGVLLWEIAAFGEEPDYQHEIRLSCPRLVGILRQGYRLQKPPGCPDRLYDVMKSCWQENPSARPEPVDLELKLLDCGQEIDPLLFL